MRNCQICTHRQPVIGYRKNNQGRYTFGQFFRCSHELTDNNGCPLDVVM